MGPGMPALVAANYVSHVRRYRFTSGIIPLELRAAPEDRTYTLALAISAPTGLFVRDPDSTFVRGRMVDS